LQDSTRERGTDMARTIEEDLGGDSHEEQVAWTIAAALLPELDRVIQRDVADATDRGEGLNLDALAVRIRLCFKRRVTAAWLARVLN